jgi:hypothetical protein
MFDAVRRRAVLTIVLLAVGACAVGVIMPAMGEATASPSLQKQHWCFVKPVRPAEPEVKDAGWVRNPIDRFILSRLEREGIRPSPEALRPTLIRRLALDLTGLPPTLSEVEGFVQDQSSDAYEKLVDRLLASAHYGERWGRHWLDVARYADSNGYAKDGPRSIWKYRDWVIEAFNRDMPFDQFVVVQLAGDLLPDASDEQIVATGFHRNTQINEEGGSDPEQFRIEAVIDRVSTTGTGLLGLSVGCAQCHNHKYDPISQREFFQLYAFLNNQDEPLLHLYADEAVKAQVEEVNRKIAALDVTLDERVNAFVATLTPDALRTVSPVALRGALQAPADQRTEQQREIVRDHVRRMDEASNKLLGERSGLQNKAITTMVLRERAKNPRVTHIHINGDFTRPGDVVTPGVLAVLHPLKRRGDKPDRLDLARWIVDPENPLTSRVTMNRVWQRYFGRGIVETENDFGAQGSPPTHPELLDWLATEFQTRQWSMKAMHRLIVTSATYRQSSNVRPDLTNADPYNKLLARQSRLRLDAEIVRDVALVASGLLTPKIGGPSVFPPQPPGVTDVGQSKHNWTTSTGPDRYRRGMYTFFFRASPHPLLGSFDAPDGTATCTRRNRSNTPLQALNLLNDEAFIEFAQAMAGRMLREAPANAGDADRVQRLFRQCVSRNPDDDEGNVLLKLLATQREAFAKDEAGAQALATKDRCPDGVTPVEFAAWTMVSRVMLNLDETITRE